MTLLTTFRTVNQLFTEAREGFRREGVVKAMEFDPTLGFRPR